MKEKEMKAAQAKETDLAIGQQMN